MTQPQALTTQQIQNYQDRIANAGTLAQKKAAAITVYQQNWGQIPIDLIVQADSTCERTRYSLFSLSIDQRLVSVSPKPMLVF